MTTVYSSTCRHGRVYLPALVLLSLLSLAPLCSCIFNSVGPQTALKVVKYASGSFFSPLSTARDNVSNTEKSASPNLLAGFPGITAYEIGYDAPEPSDMAVAAGGGYVLQAVNLAIRVFNATNGTPLTSVTPLYSFLNLPSSFVNSISDPRAFYDHLTKRFFVFISAFLDGSKTYEGDYAFQIVAVSKSLNPLNGFHYFKYNTDLVDSGSLHDAAGGCPCLADFNQAGFDQYGVYVSVNSFSIRSSAYVGPTLQAISKQDLIQGKASPTAVRFDGSPKSYGYILQGTQYSNTPPSLAKSSAASSGTIQPAAVPTNGLPDLRNGGTQYFLSSFSFDVSTTATSTTYDRRLDVWAMTNTSSLASRSPKLTLSKKTIYVKPYLISSNNLIGVQKTGDAPYAKQSGFGVFELILTDSRMSQVVFSNGTLMGSFTSLYKDAAAQNTTKTGISYVMISTSVSSITKQLQATKLHDGFFSIPGSYAFFSAVTFNRHQAMLAFGFSGASYYPSLGVFYIQKSKPYLVSNYTTIYRGKGPQDGYSGEYSGEARWGDYFAACVDEKEDFWFAGETILGGKRNYYTNWGSYISKMSGK